MRDVRKIPHFYETWVTRDAQGHQLTPNGGLLRTAIQNLASDRWLGWGRMDGSRLSSESAGGPVVQVLCGA